MVQLINSNFFKKLIIFAGLFAVSFAVFSLPARSYRPAVVAILLLLLITTPLASLKVKTSNNTVTFSDVVVFVAFVFYSWPLAVCLAATEAAVNAWYEKHLNSSYARNFLIFNSSFAAFTTAVAALLFTITSSFSACRRQFRIRAIWWLFSDCLLYFSSLSPQEWLRSIEV